MDVPSDANLGGVSPDILFCFPEDVDCPATNLYYSPGASVNEMHVSTDAASGPPLSELIYSVGQPCLIESEYNNLAKKQDYLLMKDGYYSKC